MRSGNLKEQADQYFSDEAGNYNRVADAFYYNKVCLRNYRISGAGDSMLAYAAYDYDADISDFTETIMSHSSELLCSLLTLRGQLSDAVFARLEQCPWDLQMSAKEQKAVCRWCEQYGYPLQIEKKQNFRGDDVYQILVQYPYDLTIRDTKLRELCMWGERYVAQHTYGVPPRSKRKPLFRPPEPAKKGFHRLSFRMIDFLKELEDLYRTFVLYQIVTGDADASAERMYPGKDREACRELIQQRYKAITYTNQIHFEQEEMHLTVHAATLFEAAYYQMAQLLYKPGERVGCCPVCQVYFQKKSVRQKYCNRKKLVDGIEKPVCYAQLAYKRRKSRES